MGKIRIGIIGVGRWGTNYLRTFGELKNCNVRWICASRKTTLKEALLKANVKAPVKTTINYKDILRDKETDAVAIASPGSTHYGFAKSALQANKHVIVEKPVAFSSRNVEELIEISKEKNRILMAGHLHLFNPGIQKIRADIKKGIFGKINFIHLTHFGNGPVRADMGALWDFFPHSVSILLHLLEKSPVAVSANGMSCINSGIEDVVTMDAIFANKVFATSIASWLYPIKKMEMVIVGEKLYAIFDDYAKDKLKYYYSRPKVIVGKAVIQDKGYKTQKFSAAKPLTEQLKHFLECIEKNKTPLTGGDEALKVTKILELAQHSLINNGLMVNAR